MKWHQQKFEKQFLGRDAPLSYHQHVGALTMGIKNRIGDRFTYNIVNEAVMCQV